MAFLRKSSLEFSLEVGGAKPPSNLIVGCQNWKVLVGWRYDFLGIVTTMPELAKTEQGL